MKTAIDLIADDHNVSAALRRALKPYASAMADAAAQRVREDDDCRADDEWDRETTGEF